MSALPPLAGHLEVRQALATTAAAGQLPHSLLFHGPSGIGKQRLALWLGQLLLCERGPAAPCDQCRACHLAVRLEHPDLHWFFPMTRPKSTGADRLGEALEEARAAELESRRSEPLRVTVPIGMSGIYLAQVQTLVRIASARPAMGRRKVFVIGDAELLVPQEASPEAANALLKLLEEPPADTTIVLTAADPELLLPTIRSRLLPVRLRPLGIDEAAEYLVAQGDVDPERARWAARLAGGSIGRALGFLPNGEDPGPLEEIRNRGRALLSAALDPSPAAGLAMASTESPAGARAAFSDALESLTLWLRDLGAAAAGADDVVLNRDALEWLGRAGKALPDAGGVPDAIAAVEETIQLAQLNINPQLATAALLRRVRTALQGQPQTIPG
jgi:DNA polymerase-3 subunit delta'